jgi:hypothetical protein
MNGALLAVKNKFPATFATMQASLTTGMNLMSLELVNGELHMKSTTGGYVSGIYRKVDGRWKEVLPATLDEASQARLTKLQAMGTAFAQIQADIESGAIADDATLAQRFAAAAQ